MEVNQRNAKQMGDVSATNVLATNVLATTGVCKSFDDGTLRADVLNGIDLNVKAHDCISIVGTSGSGKSTLLHILGGLDKPDAGTVEIAGQNITAANERQRGELRNRFMGFIYQFHHLLAEFSALENVAMPLLIRGESREEAYAEAQIALTSVGLAHRLQHRPGELSGGERQRAAIARAVVTRPACILADEPTGNLDRKTADNVFASLMELNANHGTALVIVTHDQTLAKQTHKSLSLEDGVLLG